MVWQEKVQFIIMLTNLVEQKKNKCARYWPEEVDSTCTYSHFSITNLKEESMLHYMIRTLQVQVCMGERTAQTFLIELSQLLLLDYNILLSNMNDQKITKPLENFIGSTITWFG